MVEAINILSKCAGVNNKVDPKNLRMNDPQTGLTDLAEGEDFDIDDSGKLSVRLGQEPISTVPSHSIFCDGGDCFVAQDRTSDTALYRMNSDYTLTGVRSGLSKSERLSYFQAGDKTYYSNNIQNGRIISAVSEAWPTSTYYGQDSLNEYSNAPVGKHIAYFHGRAWIAVGPTIYCSIPFMLGRFRLSAHFFNFNTDIRMIRPVAGGVWVSDSETTGFIAASESWAGYKYIKKLSVPAHEWSDNQRLEDLSKSYLRIPGLSAVWSCDDGQCIGTPEGQLIIETKERLIYPKGAIGATVVRNNIIINSVF